MLVTMKTLVDVAKEKHFAVPAPTVWSAETTEAAFQVGREMHTPLVIMVWDDGPEWIEKIGEQVKFYAAKYPDVVAALILDHGQSFRSAMAAAKCGYTTVMADYSSCSLEENIAKVKRIVDACHALNVSVEAELGHVGDGFEYEQTREAGLTDPAQAKEFVARTGCDMLAVAVGTSHGMYKGEPKIEFELLRELNSLVDIPLVLHGGSGTGDDNLRQAVADGITKVNLCTDLFNGYEAAVRKAAGEENADFLSMYFAGPEGYKDVLRRYVELFGSAGTDHYFRSYMAHNEPEFYKNDFEEDFKLTT